MARRCSSRSVPLMSAPVAVTTALAMRQAPLLRRATGSEEYEMCADLKDNDLEEEDGVDDGDEGSKFDALANPLRARGRRSSTRCVRASGQCFTVSAFHDGRQYSLTSTSASFANGGSTCSSEGTDPGGARRSTASRSAARASAARARYSSRVGLRTLRPTPACPCCYPGPGVGRLRGNAHDQRCRSASPISNPSFAQSGAGG
jgi:hypothetical protein